MCVSSVDVHFCVCVFVCLCFCVFVFLCFCVFVFLCFCVSVRVGVWVCACERVECLFARSPRLQRPKYLARSLRMHFYGSTRP